jgi:hypothetical protein
VIKEHAMPRCLTAIVLLLCTGAVQAAPCDSPAHRQFDFWIGDWQVHTPDGKQHGTNRIAREYDGCVLHERYTTPRAYRGESLNAYDPARKAWHQTWVDNQGLLLRLEGGLQGTSMVMQGETSGADGRVTRHRITWTPNGDGSVRQHWESSEAQGGWTTLFDGRYTRK